jgi:hypothetical protein
VFIIKYQIAPIFDDDSDEDVTFECQPVELRKGSGSTIKYSDYDIIFNGGFEGTIKDVRNKTFGTVKFKASKIDQECGYVLGSKVTIYTSEQMKDEMLNLIHIHINDMSDAITVDVAYMLEGNTIKDFETFGTDAAGQVLRYKILVKD